jgi:hypothetical protein
MSEPPNRPVPLDSLSKDGVLSAIEEAKNAPTLFSPRERSKYVRERVTEIRSLRTFGKNDDEIKEALGSFVTQYPTLFQMAVEPYFDANKLEFMLGVMEKMAGGMSQHQAAVIVGQKLADTYVKPVVDGKHK